MYPPARVAATVLCILALPRSPLGCLAAVLARLFASSGPPPLSSLWAKRTPRRGVAGRVKHPPSASDVRLVPEKLLRNLHSRSTHLARVSRTSGAYAAVKRGSSVTDEDVRPRAHAMGYEFPCAISLRAQGLHDEPLPAHSRAATPSVLPSAAPLRTVIVPVAPGTQPSEPCTEELCIRQPHPGRVALDLTPAPGGMPLRH
ncbi:hypothetical protein DFH07DRAFT_843092 [Mycena maculata]|uniref:Secreted protein n=1 Tax=Mycena maculata TaxID=230809 RepID=A0AAD7I7P9_9AGAR|nr:hypothetical protein DFH07DRAFT_843092 [Mycena maculata]